MTFKSEHMLKVRHQNFSRYVDVRQLSFKAVSFQTNAHQNFRLSSAGRGATSVSAAAMLNLDPVHFSQYFTEMWTRLWFLVFLTHCVV